ncbi:hypothetical protein M426DRAFT_23919 [Hypoxylon sp. CI-4A]|nr:hypothetical protein M426DRAFT_23919 [Hypoxylon sp. CI-4A]
MSSGPQPQVQATIQSNPQRPTSRCLSHHLAPNAVIPLKRPDKDDDDDDIQFISAQPVKKRKISGQQPKPIHHHQNFPIMAPPPMIPTISATAIGDHDRRISTGMVGLPSDFDAVELTSALRGVSLPVLEKFTFNQSSRRSRPPSSPELSPKQLPRAIPPTSSSSNPDGNSLGVINFQAAPIAHMTVSEDSAEPEASTSSPFSTADYLHNPNRPAVRVDLPSPSTTDSPQGHILEHQVVPPPLVSRARISEAPEPSQASPTSSKSTIDDVNQSDPTKQPCHICARARQQANLAKVQGFPMLPHNMPHHLIPHMVYPQPYGQHAHPQMMATSSSGIHPYGPGFTPFMTPFHGNHLTALPSNMPNAEQTNYQGGETTSQQNIEQPGNQLQPPQAPQIEVTGAPEASNPVKRPATLIQPTYRKPSPNLVVDVAETCQERFPFEDVAKRHNVPVEKVFDVFAAIIQVPLLRCPTDRRRAGKLATGRVKEYNRAKKVIQENNITRGTSDSPRGVVVKPLDIANHLGQVDLPEGFS